MHRTPAPTPQQEYERSVEEEMAYYAERRRERQSTEDAFDVVGYLLIALAAMVVWLLIYVPE